MSVKNSVLGFYSVKSIICYVRLLVFHLWTWLQDCNHEQGKKSFNQNCKIKFQQNCRKFLLHLGFKRCMLHRTDNNQRNIHQSTTVNQDFDSLFKIWNNEIITHNISCLILLSSHICISTFTAELQLPAHNN